MSKYLLIVAATLCLLSPISANAEPPSDIRELKLKDWSPKSMLVTKTTNVEKSAFPAIDVHNHLGAGKKFLTPERVAHYLAEMDAAGVRTVVNLDGMWGDTLQETLDALDNAHPGRFLTFAQINFTGIDDADWGRREAERLEAGFRAGAKGLKFHKTFGLGVRHQDGTLLKVDDPKLDAIFETCAKYHRPVMIHTADPAAFFTPLDRNNDRWHELNEHPDWLFYGKDYPTQKELLAQFIRLVARQPRTTFLGGPLRQQRRGPGDRGKMARSLSELVRGYFRPDFRTRPAAVHDAQVLSEVSRPDHAGHRHTVPTRGISHVLSLPGKRRRIFRLYPESPFAGLLDDLWRVSAQRRFGEGLFEERRADIVLRKGDLRFRLSRQAGRRYLRLDGRGVCPLRFARSVRQRDAASPHALEGEFLLIGLRRQPGRGLGLVASAPVFTEFNKFGVLQVE